MAWSLLKLSCELFSWLKLSSYKYLSSLWDPTDTSLPAVKPPQVAQGSWYYSPGYYGMAFSLGLSHYTGVEGTSVLPAMKPSHAQCSKRSHSRMVFSLGHCHYNGGGEVGYGCHWDLKMFLGERRIVLRIQDSIPMNNSYGAVGLDRLNVVDTGGN